MNKLPIIVVFILLLACEKEYFPDSDSYLDPNIIGSWNYINNTESYPVIEVFTTEGYNGKVFYTKNYGNKNSLNVIYKTNEDSINKKIYRSSRFRKGRFSNSKKYHLSILLDTLFINTSNNNYDTLIKSKYQLIFNGPNYIGCDSVK